MLLPQLTPTVITASAAGNYEVNVPPPPTTAEFVVTLLPLGEIVPTGRVR